MNVARTMIEAAPTYQLRLILACCVLVAGTGCGDDPEPWSATVSRLAPDITAAPSGLVADVSLSDGQTPPDTIAPLDVRADTGIPDASPLDVTTPQDLDGPADIGPDQAGGALSLSLPDLIAMPWVPSDGTASTRELVATVASGSPSPAELAAITVTLNGDGSLSAVATASTNPPGVRLALRFSGAGAHKRAEAALELRLDGKLVVIATVFALAGSVTTIPSATWTEHRSAGVLYGRGATVRLATAPFPDPSGSWTDSSVHVFVPDGFTPRPANDFVVHFHGHGTTVAATLPAHYYREQTWASGANAILVVPQGPVSAASGNFGKLMTPGGLTRLLDDVAAVLYRDGLVASPWVGDLVLTEHSGGYQATAINLETQTDRGQVMSAHLFDGLYGRSADFIAFARAGGFLRSDHTANGGTRTNNTSLLNTLGALATNSTAYEAMRDRRAVIWPTSSSHNDSTWWNAAFAEALRWASAKSRRGPRIELRSVAAVGDQLRVKWFSPNDDLLEAFIVETSRDGSVFATAAEVPASTSEASIVVPAGAQGLYVRVRSRLVDVPQSASLITDTYYGALGADVLVVDGFDRMFDGSFRQYAHVGAARVGVALGSVATASNEAIAGGEVRLSDFALVVWLLGDESSADESFSASEQALVRAYLDAGGRVIASGSELAWDLGARGNGSSFLAKLGATYLADNARASSARGTGDLGGVASFGFGGAGTLYDEDFPDALNAATGARVVLSYPDGKGAAVGVPAKSVVVGFPLELIDTESDLKAVLDGLVGFVRP